MVIQTGTIAAVGVAFGKFLGVIFPSISSSNWILHLWKVPPIHVGPMVLGNMDVGLNTQNLMGIIIIVLLTFINVRGVRTGAMVQNIFTIAKTAALLGLICLGIFVGRNAEAVAANFTNFWRNTGPSAAPFETIGIGGLLGVFVILAVSQVGSLFSADSWHNVTFTAAEVKNPSRNLPISLRIVTGKQIGRAHV